MLNQSQLLEIFKCVDDLTYFASNFSWVQKPQISKIVQFVPHQFQTEIFDLIQNKENGVVFKSRQVGASTSIAIGAFWRANFFPGSFITLLSKKEEDAIKLLDKVKFVAFNLAFHDSDSIETATPAEFLCGEIITDKKQVFEIGWRNDKGEITKRSTIQSLTTTSESGRGDPPTFIFMDELAFMPDSRSTFAAVTPGVVHGGHWITASTPNGTDNAFYDLVSDAQTNTKDLDYKLITVHWSQAGITKDMIKKATPGMSEDKRLQEWELQFTQPNSAVFQSVHLDNIYKPLVNHPKLEIYLNNYKKHAHNKDSIMDMYYVGVDSALGRNRKTRRGDYHFFTALTKDGVQAYAFYSNEMELSQWAGYVQERPGGTKVLIKGKVTELHEEYPGIAYIEENQSGHTVLNMHKLPTDGKSLVLPFNTNSKSKSALINALMLAVESHQITITDPMTYEQMRTYQRGQVPGSYEAAPGRNDDAVIALALAWAAVLEYGLYTQNVDENLLETVSSGEQVLYGPDALLLIPQHDHDPMYRTSDLFDDGVFDPSLMPDDLLRNLQLDGVGYGIFK